MAVPKNLPKAKVNVEEFITKDGKLDSNKFWKLSDAQIADLVGDAVHDLRAYIVDPSTHEKAASSIRLLEALDKESPDLGLSNYVTLFKSMENGLWSAVTKSYLDGLKQYDPDTFNLYLKHPGWEAYNMPDYDFDVYRAENTPKDVESNPGAFTGNPVDTVSPTETSSGVLTRPPAKLPEVKESTPVNVGRTIEEAEAEAYPPIDLKRISGNYASPTSPGVHIRVINAEGKPVDLTPEEITKFNLNTASPSPEAIGEAMREAVVRNNTKLSEATPKEVTGTELNSAPASSELSKKVTVISNKPISDEEMLKLTYPKEGVVVGPETLKPGIDTPLAEGNSAAASSPEAKVAEEATKAKTVTDKTGDGVLTGKDNKSAEPSEGMFKKIGSWMFNHPKISIGTTLGLVGGIGISQADKIAKALKAGKSPSRNIGEKPVTSSNVNYRVWENYNPDYLNEEYVPGKIPSHIPQDNLDSVKESTTSKKMKNQPQVVNALAPENNATADYVRAAYNSYIPSDAGRAYQKAIYGDPLELDRMRLQQQQQKWRDFVMRSGQSPAELVQRGLMPYDALQYI